jgi:hypothetical protein
MAFRRLTDFYYFEVGSYGTKYLIVFVLTLQSAIIGLLLDASRVPLQLFGIELSALFLMVGISLFLSDIVLGIMEKQYKVRSKGSLLMVVLEVARTTSYGALPFMWFAFSVLLYFGGPSESFFPYVKLTMFLLTVLAALPSLVKTLTLQIPLLLSTVWDKLYNKIILGGSILSIIVFGIYAYLSSVFILPNIFMSWFVYVTFMMFL